MRSIWTLRLYYLASFAVGGVYLPYFPRWLEARGIVGFRLGVLSATTPALGVLAPAVVGALADALGVRGGLLQVACAGALLSFAALTAAALFGVRLGFPELLVAALAIALFRSPMTMMADVVALEAAPSLNTTYGRLRLWGSLGFLTAATFSGWLVDARAAAPLPVAATGCMTAGWLAAMQLPVRAPRNVAAARDGKSDPSQSMPRGGLSAIRHLLAEGDFRLFLAAVFLGQCGQAAYDMFFSIHLFDLGFLPSTVGLAWGIGTGAEVVLMATTGAFFRAQPPPTILAAALACAGLRWVLLAIVRSAWIILLLQPLHAISFGAVWLACVAYTSRRFPARSLATAQGLFSAATGAGSVVGMLTWGPVYLRGGGSFVFAGAACFAVCASASAVALGRRVRVTAKSNTAMGE